MDHKETGTYWDENAEAWTRLTRMGYDKSRIHLTFPAFLKMLPDVKNLCGLDIGCGEGSNTRAVQKIGAKMTGIDISEKFIQYASDYEKENPIGVKYQVSSAVELPFKNNSFDFTMGTMSFMDIPEYSKVIQEAFRVTKPGGFLQFSCTHPCFGIGTEWVFNEEGKRKGKVIRGYFDKTYGEIEEWTFSANPNRDKEKPFKVPRFDYTLSEWLNTCLSTGWILEEICEPNPSDELLEKDPSFWTERIVALFIIYRWRKPN